MTAFGTNNEPSFELLERPGRRAGWLRGSLVLLILANVGMAAWQYQLRSELTTAQARRGQAVQSELTPAQPPSDEEAKALALLQVPVGAWLREIERCQPEGAVAEQLQVDAVNQIVGLISFAGDEVDVGRWVGCLNEQAGTSVWTLRRASRAPADGQASTANSPQSNWRLVFERRTP